MHRKYLGVQRDWVTGIHFEFCEIVLNNAFNLVDVD